MHINLIEPGVLPLQCKTAIVTCVFKKGTHGNPDNYRQIRLTCILCKVLESIVRDVIVDYIQANYLMTDFLHGFHSIRPNTQLQEVIEDLTIAIENIQSVDMIFLDFKKAFHSVPH